MKRLSLFAAGLVATLCLPDTLPLTGADRAAPAFVSKAEARRQTSISFSYFHSSLRPYGRWVQYRPYGHVFIPHVQRGWRPYSEGRWVYNHRYGWVWDSYEPFGWATFHYGWWDYDQRWGWFWVPGTQWAPSWVVWRIGPDFVGWAPMPARYVWGRPYGEISIVWRDDYWRTADHWCFTRNRDIGRRHAGRYIAPVTNNNTYIDQSTTIYNTTVINNTIVNQGPDVNDIEQRSGESVPRADVNAVAEPPPVSNEGPNDGGPAGGETVVNAVLPDPDMSVSPTDVASAPAGSADAVIADDPAPAPDSGGPASVDSTAVDSTGALPAPDAAPVPDAPPTDEPVTLAPENAPPVAQDEPAPDVAIIPEPVPQMPAPEPEYSQPEYATPDMPPAEAAPQPQYAAPAPEPYEPPPVPEPEYAAPEPDYAPPQPEPEYAAPPAPDYPQPDYSAPMPEPEYSAPAPMPEPMHDMSSPAPDMMPAPEPMPMPEPMPAAPPPPMPMPEMPVPDALPPG